MEITIIMSEAEAKWLKGVMQNPLHGESCEEEESGNKNMRKLFWDALAKEGI